ncbi:hypothetical protein StoSoilB22_34940 [Arthrobacter sp. StoSoilB22]|nr:hypothetical protein StoSoilB22_34940 [Arthrobacter sp. StoSoilB22]
MGPMSIFIASTNVVPIGSMAMPAAGASHPTRMPTTIAVNTQKYNCLYQRVFGGALVPEVADVPEAAAPWVLLWSMIPTSLWNVSGVKLKGTFDGGGPAAVERLSPRFRRLREW